MEKVLDPQITKQIQQAFDGIEKPVQVLLFTSKDNCDTCNETKQLLEEVIASHQNLELSIHDMEDDLELARKYNVSHAPGIVVAARDEQEIGNLGIQFSGIPSGYEFSTLINDILMVSRRDSGLDSKTREYLKNLDKPLHLQVFVTPTCPYCPRAVLLAHQMAMENPQMIIAEGVEATEFPDLANQFNVRGVPQTVINAGSGMVVGAVPEQNLLSAIRQALQN
jgi:glutaredoxin-like protein